ncbi:ferredoxin--NADP reductase [Candidimonas sp. SYP-B2681]|uniref:ferredoxin--NADP reductase n=1 Tax=Candidimonas sp. SYP-B2681 TaxID=2497686 RepID=UPI000F87921E|nr:ferredoxin--NADP reductase [Candidimonas sp. SYP-B2681]RTZ48191.1 ferredoxin--NADP reductase [Candidimonas sp. SYP-B2681]
MAAFNTEQVLNVRHWNDTLFSFTTTRDPALRFHNGHFVMLGLEVNGKPLMRAYSIASANYEENLEFLSIKVQDGPLTSRLQHLKEGDTILVSKKPVGTLVVDDLKPGKNLYLFATGTGLAPFLSIIKDPDVYDRFEKVVLLHGVRFKSELAYSEYIQNELPNNEYFGGIVREKLIYYPCVTRESFSNQGRITHMVESGKLSADTGLPTLNPETDRAMLCGSPHMLADIGAMLDSRGFVVSSGVGQPGDYVIERAFVEK